MTFFVGLDLGQAVDYSALVIVERHPEWPPAYDVRHIHRWPLGTPYGDVVADVGALMGEPAMAAGSTLIVDSTGVGRPVVDEFRRACLVPVSITITAGSSVTPEPDGTGFRTPKRDLIATIAVLLEGRRLRIASGLALAGLLVSELGTFRRRVSPAGNDLYASWRESEHDDLVLATALAVWFGERAPVGLDLSDPAVRRLLVGRGVQGWGFSEGRPPQQDSSIIGKGAIANGSYRRIVKN